MNKISVVVPCFNEEEVLSMFYKKTSEVLNEIEDITYELLFVDDGSKDHTKDILRALSLKDDHCEFISFSRNFGKEAAMFAGLKKSSGDYVVIMDADLQHPPILLKEMYKAVSQEGYDCCAGKRVDRTGEGKIRNFLSHTFYKVMQKMCKMDYFLLWVLIQNGLNSIMYKELPENQNGTFQNCLPMLLKECFPFLQHQSCGLVILEPLL